MSPAPQQRVDSLAGRQIAHYRIDDLIGQGGMGEVYRAVDLNLQQKVGTPRTVAVKRVRRDLLDEAEAGRRFLREARMASRLVHPFIATVFDVVEYEETPLIVMEYIEGRRFDDFICQERPAVARVREVAIEISQALGAIHAAGLVHRDLKPANLMITADGHVKVMDFGLSGRHAVASGSQGSTVSYSEVAMRGGTPEYMSPEQIRGLPLDPRSDLFSLGIVLCEALTGTHPFRKSNRADTLSSILNDVPGAGTRHGSRVLSTALGRLVLRLLSKEPSQRLQSAAELEAALKNLPALPGPRVPVAAWWTLGVAAVLALVIGWTRFGRSSEIPGAIQTTPTRPAVAVLALDEGAGDLEPTLPRMVAGQLSAYLGEATGVRAVPQERVVETASAAAGLPFLQRVDGLARALGSQWVVTFRLYPEDGNVVGIFEVHGAALAEPETFTLTRERASALARPASLQVLDLIAGGREGAGEPVGFVVARSDEVLSLYQRALESFASFDYARGLELVEEALERDPDFLLARVLEGRLLFEAGYEEQAREAVEAATALLEPQEAGPPGLQRLTVEATLAELRGDDATAERLYVELRRNDPDDPDLLVGLAAALRRQGKLDEARTAYERAVELDRSNPRLHLHLASLLAELNQHDDAERSLAEAERLFDLFRLRTGRGEIAMLRAFWEYKRGHYVQAEAGYAETQRLYEAENLPIRALVPLKSQADAQLQQWKLEEAAATYAEVIPLARRAGHSSLVASALSSLGATLGVRLYRLAEADQVLSQAVDQAVELGREDLTHSALNNRATVLNLMNRTAEARLVAGRAIELAEGLRNEPRRCRSAIRLVEAARREGRLEEAIGLLQDLARRELPEKEMLRCGLGLSQQRFEIEMDREKPEAALAAAEQALAQARQLEQPQSVANALSIRARALFLLGRVDDAERDMREAADLLAAIEDAPEIRGAFDDARLTGLAAEGDWRALLRETDGIDGVQDPPGILTALLRLNALRATGRLDEAGSLGARLLESPLLTVSDQNKVRALLRTS